KNEKDEMRLDHLKQDQTILVIKRFSERKKVFRERKLSENFVQRGDDKELVVMGEVGEFLLGGGEGGEGGRS
ncbi:hypothetical protein Tco_1280191, partial [Tanacetum coccineum]